MSKKLPPPSLMHNLGQNIRTVGNVNAPVTPAPEAVADALPAEDVPATPEPVEDRKIEEPAATPPADTPVPVEEAKASPKKPARKAAPSAKAANVGTKRKLKSEIALDKSTFVTLTCQLSPEADTKFRFCAAREATTATELMNRIIESEKDWKALNPWFPDETFVGSHFRKKRDAKVGLVKLSYVLTDENRTFVKTEAARCGMKMYQYLEFLIGEYC